MIETTSWQEELRFSLTPQALQEYLELPSSLPIDSAFPLKVTPSFLKRIEKGNPLDPLLKQVWISESEQVIVPGFDLNPLQENDYIPVKGLLHKYHGRVLLLFTGQCAIHCRYCFRRHFPYEEQQASRSEWEAWAAYIRSNTQIHEVIVSGGDPLVRNDKDWKALYALMETIPHVHTVRIHSRLPVVLPKRLTPQLLDLFKYSRLNTVMVYHANHAHELDEEVLAMAQMLKACGVCCLNQSVLLAGVNDHLEALVSLSQRLWQGGILPYYLHQLDRVAGASHFSVPQSTAKGLYEALSNALPGYLVPRWVEEVPGMGAKQAVRV